MIEGSTNLGGLQVRVTDNELMVYVPDGDGDSEIIDASTIQRLEFLLKLVKLNHDERVAQREATIRGWPSPFGGWL